jgi:hypothetical protein
VLRKLPVDGGAVVESVITEMTAVLEPLGTHDDLAGFRDVLSEAIDGLADTSRWLGERLVTGEIDDALAAATPYLTQFGTVLGGWLMAVSALAAKSEPADHDAAFLSEKVISARFYGEHLLPHANSLIPTIIAGNSLLAAADL